MLTTEVLRLRGLLIFFWWGGAVKLDQCRHMQHGVLLCNTLRKTTVKSKLLPLKDPTLTNGFYDSDL